jgi:hypothetical protein
MTATDGAVVAAACVLSLETFGVAGCCGVYDTSCNLLCLLRCCLLDPGVHVAMSPHLLSFGDVISCVVGDVRFTRCLAVFCTTAVGAGSMVTSAALTSWILSLTCR